MIRPRETQRATGASLSYDRPDDWRAQALCAEIGDADFYPLDGDHGAAKRAKAICADCDVRAECLAEAMRTGERFGIWGGTSERDRERMRRNARKAEARKRNAEQVAS